MDKQETSNVDRRAERMCKYIFKCILVCVVIAPPVAGELGCHKALLLCRLINMLLLFPFSEEKTQLVLNVDKQLEEVRELVRL